MSPKSKVYLGALTIFIFGAVAGGFGSAMCSYGAPFGCHKEFGGFGGHHKSPEKLLERMSEKLSLTPDQQGKVREIFERSLPEMRKMKDEHFEAKKAFRQKVGDEIRGVLTPEQQPKFDELRKKMQERMESKRKEWGERWGRRGE